MPEEVYYTPEKVAELASCVRQTVYRHLEEGKFPGARRIGQRKWIIPEPAVIEYLQYDPNEVTVRIVN